LRARELAAPPEAIIEIAAWTTRLKNSNDNCGLPDGDIYTGVPSFTVSFSEVVTDVSEKPGASIFWAEVQMKAPTSLHAVNPHRSRVIITPTFCTGGPKNLARRPHIMVFLSSTRQEWE
jgi:hypothetical protein